MNRSCGTSLRMFGWLICLAGCANFPLHAPTLPDESLAPAIAASGGSKNSGTASGQPETASGSPGVATAPAPLVSAGRSPAAAAVEPQDMPSVLAELEALGAIDAPTRDRLVADLKRTDPALWPQLLDYFKASLAYRQKYVTGDAIAQDAEAPAARSAAPATTPAVAARVADEPPRPVATGAKRALAARPTAAASVKSADAELNADPRDSVIIDQAVQPATYQAPVSQAAETAPAVTAATSPPVATATAGAVSPGGTSSASVPAVVSESAPAATPPAAAQTEAAPSGASPVRGPTNSPAPATPLATAGAKPDSPALAAENDQLDWHAHLKAAIRGLERETADPPSTTPAIGRHAGLRLLYLINGDRDDALRPLSGVSATQQDFWSQQLFGLSTYLDAERTPDDARRAAAAVVHLRDANLKLGDLATLSVRNLAFATEVHSYGVYKKFERYEFHPGQEVLLYAEVENFKSAASDQGFHTALKSSYQILDNRGARVDQKEFEITEEHCQNPRRDYFIRYFVWMPKRIYGGTYTLQLTIEDTLSQKIGQASIEFTVADKE